MPVTKSAGVLRWGGFGDMLMASIVFPYIKAEGYHLTVYGTHDNMQVVRHDPHIDSSVSIEAGSIKPENHHLYWEPLEKKHDKWVNLSGSIEEQLLKVEGSQAFGWSKELRHQVCDVNYYDWTMMCAGYPYAKGNNVQMYYSPEERFFMHHRMMKYKKYFKVVWVLAGSSPHKAWPYTEILLQALLHSRRDVMLFFVGDTVCDLLANRWWLANGDPDVGRRVKAYCGKLTIRSTLLMLEHVDLVVGPETGVMNAAGGLDVPKVLFLSHSSWENLPKYWVNTFALLPNADCYPCHQLHYSAKSCPLADGLETPICQASIEPGNVARVIDDYYEKWRDSK